MCQDTTKNQITTEPCEGVCLQMRPHCLPSSICNACFEPSLYLKSIFMKINFVIAALIMVVSTHTSAGCTGTVVNGRCIGAYIDNPNVGTSSNSNSNSGYQSSSGTRYQYDMNNLGDRNKYSTDLDAQRRDQMNLNTRRNLDRGLGQNGGGIFSND